MLRSVSKTKWELDIPPDYVVLTAIQPGGLSYGQSPITVSYDLAPHIKDKLNASFGAIDITIDHYRITASSSVIEWFLEQMGWSYTARLRDNSNSDSALDIDDATMVMVLHYPHHSVLKFKSEVSFTLALIRYGQDIINTKSIEELSKF